MKYIITESQYKDLMESEYSPRLMRRYKLVEKWLDKNLPHFYISHVSDEQKIKSVTQELLDQIQGQFGYDTHIGYDYGDNPDGNEEHEMVYQIMMTFRGLDDDEIVKFVKDNYSDKILKDLNYYEKQRESHRKKHGHNYK